MRSLTKKQKQLLDKFYEENKSDLLLAFDLEYEPNFTYELLDKLKDINNTEILNQEVNRYINDKVSKGLND